MKSKKIFNFSRLFAKISNSGDNEIPERTLRKKQELADNNKNISHLTFF